MTVVNFRDLLTLSLMLTYIQQNGAAPRQRDLFDDSVVYKTSSVKTIKAGLLNKAIVDQGIPPVYADTVTGFKQIDQIMQRLRAAGLLVPRDPLFKRAPYQLTDAGGELIGTLDEDWRKWPLQLNIENGQPQWEKALYYGLG